MSDQQDRLAALLRELAAVGDEHADLAGRAYIAIRELAAGVTAPPAEPRAEGLREALAAWERNGAANRKSLAAFGLHVAATPPQPAALDVEALARALVKWAGDLHALGLVTLDDDGRPAAHAIAAEYARFTTGEQG